MRVFITQQKNYKWHTNIAQSEERWNRRNRGEEITPRGWAWHCPPYDNDRATLIGNENGSDNYMVGTYNREGNIYIKEEDIKQEDRQAIREYVGKLLVGKKKRGGREKDSRNCTHLIFFPLFESVDGGGWRGVPGIKL